MSDIIQVIVSGLLIGSVFALIAIALNVVFGVMEIVNFAHGSFVMLGMYFAYWLSVLFHINPYVAIFLGLPVFFLFGMGVQKILINRILGAPPINQFLLTLGLMLFLDNLALLLWKPDYRTVKGSYASSALSIGGIDISIARLVACGIMVLAVIALHQFLTKTYSGKAIRATADDREGAYLVGINVPRVYLFAFGISAALAGIAGISIIPFFYVFPYVGFYFVITAYICVVLGGLGSFAGALLGGLIIGVSESVAGLYVYGSLKMAVPLIIFIIVLLFRPSGIFAGK
jgi:branched-chain amino acid transport system permease protein